MFFKGSNAIVDYFVSSSHVLSLVCTRMHVEGDLEKLIFSPAQPGITRDIRGAWISVNGNVCHKKHADEIHQVIPCHICLALSAAVFLRTHSYTCQVSN